ncbi:MAG: S9 family peptidase [Acidobacteria bacterium]|nr:S9 family peptidase [Acidobacteriota bacterium]
MTHKDYDRWRSIQGQRISDDGKFLAYSLVPQDGDSEVVVQNLASGTEWRYNTGNRRALTPPDDESAEPGPGGPVGAGGGVQPAVFTADNRALVFMIQPTKAEQEQARKEKKKPEEMPKNALGIMNLSSGQVTRIDRVKNFRVPESAAGFIAYSLEAKAGETAPTNGNTRGRRKDYGTGLVMRNMTDESQRTFADVLEYTISRDAKVLAFTVSSRNEETDGVYTFVPGSASEASAVMAGKGKYTRLTWDEKQTQLAFLSDRDDAAAPQPKLKLYDWERSNGKAVELVSAAAPNFKPGWVVSERGAISFSNDGSKVFFGTAPATEPEPAADDQAPADERVVVDLWHWKDDFIQPMQKVRANQERNRSYRAVYHKADKKLVQLADLTMPGLNATVDGRWGIGNDDRPYRLLVGVETNYSDYLIVNTADGARKPFVQKLSGNVSISPGGKFGAFYQNKHWHIVGIPDGRVTDVTRNLDVAFWNEEHDSPSAPGSHGNAGWTKDDKYFLLYDRYDIWQIPTDGSAAKNLTNGIGRREKTVFRYVRLEQQEPGEERGIDPTEPLLLSAVNEITRDEGFYRDRIDGGLPEKLVMAAKNFSAPTKAKNADAVILTASTFNEFPDVLVTNPNFTDMKRVTNANPQKADLLWGTSELIRYKNMDGVPLNGILIKPENFDPAKKYPMLVYIYERLSQNLHNFVNPSPGTSINASYYASNGYLVLMPDIVYTVGYPGQSALKAVLPAIQAVVDKGFVNEEAIGIQGHSWGGYQIAYMVTQTNRFKAAAPGAVVANMTSAYSGIRWGSGLPRQFQYEQTQSRIGGSLWEEPMRFLENSPIFRADRIKTPLMMIHNDADDAVPWYQGIEMFLALRRLGKEAYMFNYNGEPHGLRKRQNQEDYTGRLQQFFDHFLKGAPKPDWMEVGVPYLQRDKVNTKK